MGFRSPPVTSPEYLLPHHSSTINHERHRQRARAIGQADTVFGIMKDGEGQMVLLLKRPGDCCSLWIGGNSKNLKVLARIHTIQLLHRRHLHSAGATPGRPEIK